MLKLLLAIVLCLPASAQSLAGIVGDTHQSGAAPSAPTFVNAVASDDGFSSGTAWSTGTKSLTAGNTVWVVAGFNNACSTITGAVTDHAGNTYSQIGTLTTENSVGSCMGHWKSVNVTGDASNVYTITWSTSVSLRTIGAIQMNGSSAPDVDTSAGGNGTGTTATSDQFTTTQANEFLVAGMQVALTSCTPDTGWAIPTGGQSVENGWMCMQTKTVSAIQTGATTTMTSGSYVKTLKVATFK